MALIYVTLLVQKLRNTRDTVLYIFSL